MACCVAGPDISTSSHTGSGYEPAGDLAGRLATLARMFAMPVSDITSLEGAGLQVEGIAETDLDEDELAAAHYRVLSHDLVPDAGVFLEDEGMLGGPLARSLHAHMTSTGFTPDDSTRSSGHMVNELGFLAHLLRSGYAIHAVAFWREHASGWMPLVALHLHGTGSTWFDALEASFGAALRDLRDMAGHHDARGIPSPISPSSPTLPPVLPEAHLDLDEPKVGLSRIGSYLAVPARSGLVLSRSTLAEIGRAFRLPTGFGSRARIVEGLLRSAAHYDGWDAVCDALLAECDRSEACWASSDSVWAERWKDRLSGTRAILLRMRDAQGAVTGSE